MVDTKRLRELHAKATRGKWRAYRGKLRPQFPVIVYEIWRADGTPIIRWPGFDGVKAAAKEIAANVNLIVAAHNDLLALCDAYDALAELIAVEDADIPLSEFKQRHREAVKRARQLLGSKP